MVEKKLKKTPDKKEEKSEVKKENPQTNKVEVKEESTKKEIIKTDKNKEKKKTHPSRLITILLVIMISTALILSDYGMLLIEPSLYTILLYSDFGLIGLFIILFIHGHLTKHKKNDSTKNDIKKEDNKIPAKNKEVILPQYKPKDNETQLDIMLKIIEEKESVTLTSFSKSFNVDKKLIEEWATILEDNNLAKIEYPMFGDVIIKKWNSKDTK